MKMILRRSLALVSLFVVGCETSSKPDTDAAREFVRSYYSNVDIVLDVEEPEYVVIRKTPKKGVAAACGVRVKFTWRDGNRTTHDDWVVWVTSDHKAVEWSSYPDGDKWRQYVRSFAKK